MNISLTSIYAIVRIHNVVVVVIDTTSVIWATLSGTSRRWHASWGPAATRTTAVTQLRASGIVAVVSLVGLLSRRQSVVSVFGRLVSRTCQQTTQISVILALAPANAIDHAHSNLDCSVNHFGYLCHLDHHVLAYSNVLDYRLAYFPCLNCNLWNTESSD